MYNTYVNIRVLTDRHTRIKTYVVYYALILRTSRKRLVQCIEYNSSDGAIALTGTKKGLTTRVKAKCCLRNASALHDKQRSLVAVRTVP